MNDYLPIDEFIKLAEQKGVDFGNGDPYNRLRYYTKIGWIPHMTRMKGDEASTKGHLSKSIVDRLLYIQELKDSGMTNDEITEELSKQSKFQTLISIIKSEKFQNKFTAVALLVMLFIVLVSELGVIKIGKSQTPASFIVQNNNPNISIIDAGSAFMPRGEKTVFVTNVEVTETSKIYVSFKNDFSPAAKFWISEQIPGTGFRVELDAPTLNDAEFDWWITN